MDVTSLFPGVTPTGSRPPLKIKGTQDRFTDSRLAETIADDVLAGRFLWVAGLGWLGWDEIRWDRCSDVTVGEAVRQYMLERHLQAVTDLTNDNGGMDIVKGWQSVLSASRQRAVLGLARGLVERRPEELDAYPDLLNTPDGVVNLRTGELFDHSPAYLMTKVTRGRYRPGFTHRDWLAALEALEPAERAWLQARIGQAITGHPTPDGVLPVCQGSGENGKSLLLTDGLVPALGDYAAMASVKLFQATKGTEHSTERAELRGKRLLVAEELTEGRSIDVVALKQIQDVGQVTARHIRQDNMTFETSHSLFATTNYVPVINETDHGTWRRLALLRFPFTWRKADEPLIAPTDRRGDERLKARIKANESGQHDAMVTWAIEGARRWYTEGPAALALTERIRDDTRAWRADADRILGYWNECLLADPDSCVLTSELRDDFNQWLKANGHNEWSKELFGPRFLQHDETRRHGVEEARPRTTKGLRRPDYRAWEPLPGRPVVYRGVRYRNDTKAAVAEERRKRLGQTGQTL